MTITSVVYLLRSRTGLSEHDGIFNAVWQVIWASAAPPLLIMTVPVVAQFLNLGPWHPAILVPAGMSGKLFLLSLMISVLGRGYIREKLSIQSAQPSDPLNSTA
ncbi:hypothetical protein FRC12_016361 [Ceratobasidium sp. 428]|nr:hypothetical protein FRC12_016361 [Ceratobasidium sp. 428]